MTGIQEITWTGFANQTFSLKPAVDSVLTLPPIKVSGVVGTVFYGEAIRVEAKYIPKSFIGNWFVQRQILEGFDLSKSPQPPKLLSTTNLSINSQGLAITKPGDLVIDLWSGEPKRLRYQLARWVTAIKSPKPFLQLLDEYIEVFPIPILGQPAYTVDMYRPLPCEFETVKFEILGKTKENGKEKVLQTIKGGAFPPINVPSSEAKTKAGPPDNLHLTYAARWTLKRINLPNFEPTQGYVVQMGKSGNVFIAELTPVVSGLNLPGDVKKEFTLKFDIQQAVNSGVTTRQLCLGNAVTNSKFTGQLPASVQAETNLKLNW